jgi:hypothetical protein
MCYKRLETEDDVKRQKIMADFFINNMNKYNDLPNNIYTKEKANYPFGSYPFELVKCSDKYICDYLVTTSYGKCKAILECKWRFTSWNAMKWKSYLSLHKLAGIIQLGNCLNVPVFFLMRVQDGLYYKLIEPNILSRLTYTEGGRYDRGEKDDVEPMGLIVEKYWDIYQTGLIQYPEPVESTV